MVEEEGGGGAVPDPYMGQSYASAKSAQGIQSNFPF